MVKVAELAARFWQEVFLVEFAKGVEIPVAARRADEAVTIWRKRVKDL